VGNDTSAGALHAGAGASSRVKRLGAGNRAGEQDGGKGGGGGVSKAEG